MMMHLLSLDTNYINCIEKGPHVHDKIEITIRLDGSEAEDVEVTKSISEFTKEDEKEVHKDKKAVTILLNGFDTDMFDNLINCTTAKEFKPCVKALNK